MIGGDLERKARLIRPAWSQAAIATGLSDNSAESPTLIILLPFHFGTQKQPCAFRHSDNSIADVAPPVRSTVNFASPRGDKDCSIDSVALE